MKLESILEQNDIKTLQTEQRTDELEISMEEIEFAKENNLEKNSMHLNNKINSVNRSIEDEKSSNGVEKTINSVTKTLEENIANEINKLKLDDSIFEKISKSSMMDVVKVAIEAILKGVLKKKFGINFSTFNEMKDTINDAMDGNLKEAVKNGTDAAIDKITMLDAVTKSIIKTIKNSVIDKTIDSEKYEIVNTQTKILNRISDNCMDFNEALKVNDPDTMKKKVTSIKNDMKKILPIRETIVQAQCVLDKYSLWQNKGEKMLTNEEIELIEKLNVN